GSTHPALRCHPARSVGIYHPCAEAGHHTPKAVNNRLTRRTRRNAENCTAIGAPCARLLSAISAPPRDARLPVPLADDPQRRHTRPPTATGRRALSTADPRMRRRFAASHSSPPPHPRHF